MVLVSLLGAALALFLTKPSLRVPYDLPQLRVVLTSLYAVGAGLLALLTAIRFTVEQRRFDLLLSCGFTLISLAGSCSQSGRRWLSGRRTGWSRGAASGVCSPAGR